MHKPVLLGQVLHWLSPAPGRLFVDATIGAGGAAEALLERLVPGGRLLGVDADAEALVLARQRLARFEGHFELVHDNFRHLAQLVIHHLGRPADGVLMDIGVSSHQLDDPARGFSFLRDGPLDLRMDRSRGQTAAELLARSSEEDLARVFREFGEERFARRIARAVVRRRGTLRTTRDLAELIETTVPRRERRIHPATRVFQALRIWVNDELGALQEAMNTLPAWLAPGGRVAVISFHSLEDRIVKQALRAYAAAGVVTVLTRKPIRPSQEEVAENPRSRSARLRVAQRLAS